MSDSSSVLMLKPFGSIVYRCFNPIWKYFTHVWIVEEGDFSLEGQTGRWKRTKASFAVSDSWWAIFIALELSQVRINLLGCECIRESEDQRNLVLALIASFRRGNSG